MNYLNIFWKSVQSYPAVQSNPTLPVLLFSHQSNIHLSLHYDIFINSASTYTYYLLFFLLFHQLADDEVLIIFLQTSLFLLFPYAVDCCMPPSSKSSPTLSIHLFLCLPLLLSPLTCPCSAAWACESFSYQMQHCMGMWEEEEVELQHAVCLVHAHSE